MARTSTTPASYRIVNMHDLHPTGVKQLISLMSHDHVPMPESERFTWMAGPKTHTIALVKSFGGKETVIAGLQTNGRQKVYNWAGRLDRQAVADLGHTAAHELMLHHVKRLDGRNVTYDYGMQDSAANFFDKRVLDQGAGLPIRRDESRTIPLTEDIASQKPVLPVDGSVWKPLDWGRHMRQYANIHAAQAAQNAFDNRVSVLLPRSRPKTPEVADNVLQLRQEHLINFKHNLRSPPQERNAEISKGVSDLVNEAIKPFAHSVTYRLDPHPGGINVVFELRNRRA